MSECLATTECRTVVGDKQGVEGSKTHSPMFARDACNVMS